MKIPKLFHRIWLGDRQIPAEHQEFAKTWERLHPEWEMVLWTESTLPAFSESNRWAYDNIHSYASLRFCGNSETCVHRYGFQVST